MVQYNCRGYKRDEFTGRVLEGADVILLNETWTSKANQGSELQTSTHKTFAISSDCNYDYASVDSRGGRGHGGVAILARNDINIVMVSNDTNERVLSAVIKGHSMEILLIAVYLPTGTQTEKVIELQETIDTICGTVDEHGRGRMVIIGGDLNVDLTREVHSTKKYVTEMMEEYDLVIPMSQEEERFSFYISETKPVSLLDYFLVGREHVHLISEYVVNERSALNKSDHEPILMKVEIASCRQLQKQRPKIDWGKARREGQLEVYRERVMQYTDQANDMEAIVKGISRAANLLPRKGKLNKASRWWTSGLSQLRQKCLAARRVWKQAPLHDIGRAEEAFRRAKRAYLDEQKKQRLIRQAWEDQKLEAECIKLSQNYFHHMRRNRTRRTVGRLCIDGREVFQPDELAEAFLAHFVKTGQPIIHDDFDDTWERSVSEVVEAACRDFESNVQLLETVEEITKDELKAEIQRLKKNKAPGHDAITPEHLTQAEGEANHAIVKEMQEILETGVIPENFKYGLITPVYKGHGSDPASTDSYRDISVLTVLCKLFEKMITRRLNEGLAEAGIPSELQFAYQSNRSTLQANFILQEVISANMDLGKPVYLAFLDVRKCFNSIWHNGLLYKLIRAKIPPRLVLILRNMYREFNIRVKIQAVMSGDGKIEQGLKQGGVLSTSMLTMFMDDKIRAMLDARVGATIGEKTVPVIAYADDEVLISTDPAELQMLLDIAYQHSRLWRYRYSAAKSKVVLYGTRRVNHTWKLGSEILQTVDQYTHLGIIMSPKLTARKRIEAGMNNARRALYARCDTGLNISRKSPLSLYAIWKTYAEPCLVYGLAVTRLTATDARYLERMLLRLFRLMQGLPPKTQDIVTYAMIGAPPCRSLVKTVTMQYIGFLLKAAREHKLTEYIITHGAVNADRKSSLVQYWEEMLLQLGLPSLTEILSQSNPQTNEGWRKVTQEAIERDIAREILDAVQRRPSIHWLKQVLSQEKTYMPPANFWVMSRYNPVARLATATKIKLLTGHSWLTTGTVRRHLGGSLTCPLCASGIETLEHFLFECRELIQEREQLQERYGVKLERWTAAEKIISGAGKQESMLIHHLYRARVQKELSADQNRDPRQDPSNP